MSNNAKKSKELSEPGWRIEQKYSNKVLIGNWQEERRKFQRSSKSHNSCYGIDFVYFPGNPSGPILRRSIMKRMEGLPKQHLITHHGEPNNRNLVSVYDDHYIRHGNSALPPLRTFNGTHLAWVPECSDYPTVEPPTNYGLKEEKERKWRESSSNDIRSLYSASYKKPPPAAYAIPRYGVAPCILSSNMHHSNNLNKSLDFRYCRHLQVPDHPVQSIGSSLGNESPCLHQKSLPFVC
ncbi:Hypothetical predicted protein [Pelobates cultripes]|uniref:Uncharacterized protein n=1 Tax=Pelobates cultripes TaxID=61616 RepID=A0AAD1TAS4_PELCU|nr:Hypothetical predicted protein [Pelobates cultripes]